MLEYIGATTPHQDARMRQLLLASTSPFRRAMLERAGLPVTCVAPGVDEGAYLAAEPGRRALDRALAKADAVRLEEHQLGVAGDQVAWDPTDRVCFGKPTDADAHLDQLRRLCGRVHELHTAWAVWSPSERLHGVEVTRIHLRSVPDDELRAYVADGEGRGCAGGYAVEGKGSFLIERIEGDWFSVVGLPLYAVHGALRALGWSFP